jgi:predicted DNA-binding transcriptional regulator YafY
LANIEKRIRLLPPETLPSEASCFEAVANAVVKRHQLQITLAGRSGRRGAQRQISPQRLSLSAHEWLLEGVSHPGNEPMLIKLTDIETAQVLNAKAKDVALGFFETAVKK